MISIIIPVYNAENYIEDCVNSVLCQSFIDWELILINNGSTDKSPEICRRLAEGDARIRFFHQEVNAGVSVARNLGMEQAEGEWITFVDGDDLIKPDFLEVLWKLRQEVEADMVVCGYEKIRSLDRKEGGKLPFATLEGSEKLTALEMEENRNGASPEVARRGKKQPSSEEDLLNYRIYGIKEYLESYLLEGNTHCWGVLYKKELLTGIQFPGGLSIGEDLLFLIDAALAAEKIAVTDYSGYCYFINMAGAMERPFTPSYVDQITCWQQAGEKLLSLYPQLKLKLESILLVSVLLVAGKLAGLSKEERKKYQKEQAYCHSLVKEYSKDKAVFSYLPSGYPVKVRLYRWLPDVYMALYGLWKSS
ncbi:MAG: glycosyltransferase [Lachnospiraceae bacterium]|nr:glycosyltransferase [Lachnospiraceae bacterium]